MSRRFGLDWKQYDSKRMGYFMKIMEYKGKRREKESKRASKKK